MRRLKTTSRRLPGGHVENPREVTDITRLPRFGSARFPAPPEGHAGRRRAGKHIPAHRGPPPEENALRRQKVPGQPSGARLLSTRHICRLGISEAVGDGLRCFPSRRTRPPRRVGTEAPVIVRADNALSRLSLTPFQSGIRPLSPASSGLFGPVFFCAYPFVFLSVCSFFQFVLLSLLTEMEAVPSTKRDRAPALYMYRCTGRGSGLPVRHRHPADRSPILARHADLRRMPFVR